MAKRKKKKKALQRRPQPLKGKELAEKVVSFTRRILEICEIFGAREEMEKVTHRDMSLMYHMRFRPVRLVGAEGLSFPNGLIGVLRKILDDTFFNKRTFNFPGYDEEVSYKDYFTYVLTLRHWYRTLEGDEVKDKAILGQRLKPLLDLGDEPENPEQQLETLMNIISCQLSKRPDLLLYYFDKDLEVRHEPNFMVRIVLTLKMIRPGTKNVRFDGETREVFSVGHWQHGKLEQARLKTDDLSENTVLKGLTLLVFIQKHAWERLKERLDVFDPSGLLLHIGESAHEGKIVRDGPNRGLLAYYYFGYHLGYFVVEIIEGIAIMRTFLFLTNDGTPEGKKLSKNLGIRKLDKKYTGLDRLSTYMYGDLKEDEQLYALLKDAGCGTLLNISPLLKDKREKNNVPYTNEALRKYLELDEKANG